MPSSAGIDATTRALRAQVDTIVVIYAENRAFDNLYGNFPGAHGLGEVVGADGRPLAAYLPQRDRDGSLLAALPPPGAASPSRATRRWSRRRRAAVCRTPPFSIEHAFTAQSGVSLSTSAVTRDLVHRFFEHQMQIDGGRNDGYAAWSDAGGLTMGHFDTSRSALFALAGNSCSPIISSRERSAVHVLNHQYLICACAPGVSRRRHVGRQTLHRPARPGCRGAFPAPAHGGQELARIGARRTAEVREERQSHAGGLLRGRKIPTR